ncbi:MAG: LytTR family DNA-binding domain-containing protein [Tepidibacter sp.]|jgi:DNA-binding LytR/AlgR family response regulator|uniref:LytR/AlgR family response regulator transcription factor n=1 Tax=Tepidibacter sp. TaxID=2529387 RepID=UPI0025EB0A75|nr:LytTR family DNA-binding domain-containing protein [Tepidibacter sp.]MCT4508787.1 LytTR family DNA-binding domain-containing protein [Tepidibacter sp.]
MGINVLICDDDKIVRNHIVKVASKIKDIEFIKTAENGLEAVQRIKKGKFDILIMDVDMPQKNGIDAAKDIFKINPDVYIIFVTGFREYALDAFDVYSFDYILKPFNEKRLVSTLEKAMKEINLKKHAKENSNNEEKFIFKKDRKRYIVNLNDIYMFEKNARVTRIYTSEIQEDFYESFYDIEERLSSNFFRSHKSFIVNIDKVSEIVPYNKTSFEVSFKESELKALLSKKNEIKFLNELYLHKKKVI